MCVTAHLPHPRELLRVGPHAEAHWVAIRTGIAVAAPLSVLTATGRMQWAVYAAFGAFAAVYGRGSGYRRRAHMQVAAAITLTVAVVSGAGVSAVLGTGGAARWAVVGASALVAVAGSLVGDVVGWRPAGPLFAVFAVATCASVPAGPGAVGAAALVAGASAAFAVLVGLSGGISPRRRTRDRLPSPPAGLHLVLDEPAARRHAARYAVAVLIAGSVATLAGIGHPAWAMVAAVAPLSVSDTPGQVLRAAHRVAGTAVGLLVAAVLLSFGLTGGVLVLVVVLLQVVTELLVVRNYGLAMLTITPLALLMNTLGGTASTGALLGDRAVETAIGAAVGCGVALVSAGALHRH
ncbi:FUSC family protein [Cellulomonas soli]|uniref:FUSC family protein n=1 Tax=Cellulomonas soli TaxID=931535 RepID=UPI003F8595A1